MANRSIHFPVQWIDRPNANPASTAGVEILGKPACTTCKGQSVKHRTVGHPGLLLFRSLPHTKSALPSAPPATQSMSCHVRLVTMHLSLRIAGSAWRAIVDCEGKVWTLVQGPARPTHLAVSTAARQPGIPVTTEYRLLRLCLFVCDAFRYSVVNAVRGTGM